MMSKRWQAVFVAVTVVLGGSAAIGCADASQWFTQPQRPQAFQKRIPTEGAAPEFAAPQRVIILGYDGDAMEPFLSRDGNYLFFNNNNNPRAQTDIFWAERIQDITFQFRGPVAGVNVPDKLDAVPSMTQSGEFLFITDRSYAADRNTIYRGKFSAGAVTGVQFVTGVTPVNAGIVNFDAEISADGKYLYAVYGDLSSPPVPKTANLFVARRANQYFERLPESAKIMANVNTGDLEYAPSTTANGLHLYFTRMSLATMKPTIEYSFRRSMREPFSASQTISAIKGFAEAPCITSDNNAIFYHAKVDGRYQIFVVSRK